jgi:hypothetical protein
MLSVADELIECLADIDLRKRHTHFGGDVDVIDCCNDRMRSTVEISIIEYRNVLR